MQIKDMTAAYEMFVQVHAEYAHKTAEQVKTEIDMAQFEAQLHELHEQYMAGVFSFGRFTELIGVPHWELWQILDMMGLQLHN